MKEEDAFVEETIAQHEFVVGAMDASAHGAQPIVGGGATVLLRLGTFDEERRPKRLAEKVFDEDGRTHLRVTTELRRQQRQHLAVSFPVDGGQGEGGVQTMEEGHGSDEQMEGGGEIDEGGRIARLGQGEDRPAESEQFFVDVEFLLLLGELAVQLGELTLLAEVDAKEFLLVASEDENEESRILLVDRRRDEERLLQSVELLSFLLVQIGHVRPLADLREELTQRKRRRTLQQPVDGDRVRVGLVQRAADEERDGQPMQLVAFDQVGPTDGLVVLPARSTRLVVHVQRQTHLIVRAAQGGHLHRRIHSNFVTAIGSLSDNFNLRTEREGREGRERDQSACSACEEMISPRSSFVVRRWTD